MGSELGVKPDSKAQALITPVSIWWVCWCAVWSLTVLAGVSYLIANRNASTLRIRGLGLSLSAIFFLHLFSICPQIGLMIGPIMPGDVQFWVMGTWLPCGIALFHASNTRFLHVAKLQKKYFRPESRLSVSRTDAKGKGLLARFRRLSYDSKILMIVGLVVTSQVFLTVLMYLISRKYHSTWGIPGTELHGTKMEQLTEMGRGWEW